MWIQLNSSYDFLTGPGSLQKSSVWPRPYPLSSVPARFCLCGALLLRGASCGKPHGSVNCGKREVRRVRV
eukprot:6196480-Pleurochrysis_carterae.AAC.2